MRRREFIGLLGAAPVALPIALHAFRQPYDRLHIDVCIYCMIYLASGLTPPEHQTEWSLTAIVQRWGPEWVLVLRDEDDRGAPGGHAICAAARGLVLAFMVSRAKGR